MPALIVAVEALPLTTNGKRSERAARDAVNGRDPDNAGALANPGSLAGILVIPITICIASANVASGRTTPAS